MDEKAFKSEMRLFALESLVTKMFAVMCTFDPNPGDIFKRMSKAMLDAAGQASFPGWGDPAKSDLTSAELENYMSRLMEMTAANLKAFGKL